MSKTAKQTDPTPEKMDEQIAALEAERAELESTPPEISWDELVANSAAFEARERRRKILPWIIEVGRIKRLELEKRRHAEHVASLREDLAADYESFQEREEKLRQAQEERDAAHAKWTQTLGAVNSAESRAKRMEREIQELREGRR